MVEVQKALARWLDYLIDAMAILAGAGILFVMIITTYDVVGGLFGRSAVWAVELSEYGLLYVTFLAAPWILKQNALIELDILTNLFPAGVRRGLNLFANLLGIAVSGYLLWIAAHTTADVFVRGAVLFRNIVIPEFVIIGIIPIGLAMLLIQFLRRVRTPKERGPA